MGLLTYMANALGTFPITEALAQLSLAKKEGPGLWPGLFGP